MTDLLKAPPGFDADREDYRGYWVAFASAALAGLSASPACADMSPGDIAREAALSADLLLTCLKDRITC